MKRLSVVFLILLPGLSIGVINFMLGGAFGFGLHFAAARAGWLVEDIGAMRWVVLFGGLCGATGFVYGVIRGLPDALQAARRGRAVDGAAKLALPDLLVSLRNKDPYVRYGASFVLMERGVEDRTATQALTTSLRDPEPLVRRNCGVALLRLAEAKSPEAVMGVPALTTALTDADVEVRKLAIMTLGALGTEARSAFADLRQRLNDSDGEVRIRACQAVAKFGADGATATSDLVRLLADRYSCEAAAFALRDLRAAAPSEVDRLAAEALPECGKKRTCETCGAIYRFSEGRNPGYWIAAGLLARGRMPNNLAEILALTLCPTHFQERMDGIFADAFRRARPRGE